jgi:D-amino-acid oxidase
VINCSGLGAGTMVGGDKDLFPVQGSVVKISPLPQVTKGRFLDAVGEDAEMAYIIPRVDCYVLGGTAIPNSWSKEPPSEDVVRGIVERCNELAPGIATKAKILVSQTDLRPVRSEKLALGTRTGLPVDWIDSYGYGGSGWTMFLGASLFVTKLVGQIAKAKL